MTIDYVYSDNGETYNMHSEEEMIEQIISDMTEQNIDNALSDGDYYISYYKASPRNYVPSDFIGSFAVDNFLDDLNCRAGDECGEYAEDFAMYIPKASTDALQKLLETWADEHLDCTFYGVKDVEEIKVLVTKELIDKHG